MCLVPILALTAVAQADEDYSKEVVKATPLTATVSMLEGAGGNITALIGEDGTLLVDDDFAPMAGKLLAKLKELKGGSPRIIVNTHFHYDHTGGNEVFGSSATILAATSVRERLASEQVLWRKQHPAVPNQALPILTFERSVALHMNGEDVKVVHLPHGHTDGDTVVFFERSHVVSMGDLYFAGMYPIFHPEHKGSLNGVVRNLEWVLERTPADAKVVPGHGPLSNRPELERYRQMILASIATVKGGLKKGWTLERIQKAGLPAEWEPYSHGYRNTDQWLESVYGSLKRN